MIETVVPYLHVMIALAYIALGCFAVALRFPTRWETWGARVGWLLFFNGCALTHFYDLAHILSDTTLRADSFAHVLATLMQVIGAPLFLICAAHYIRYFPRLLRRLPVLIRAAQAEEKRGESA